MLAIGSVAAGYAGIGGRFERFLEPSFGLHAEEATADAGLETTLMVVSSLVAVAGIGIAMFFFLKRREAADRVARRFAGLHRVLEHKYYVDEVYDAALVQPNHLVSEEGLWKTIDVKVIDGAVNGVADAVRGGSEILRLLQTGSVRAYAASLFLGVVMVRVLLMALIGPDPDTKVKAKNVVSDSHFPDRPADCRRASAALCERRAARAMLRTGALVVTVLVFLETLLLWARFDRRQPTFSSSSATRGSRVRDQLFRRRGWNQSAAPGAHRVSDAARLLGSWVSVHKHAGRSASSCCCSSVMGVFISLDLFLFYVFWDAMLIRTPHRDLRLSAAYMRR